MNNWSTNTSTLLKNKELFTIWKLEQMVNFGLQGKLLSRTQLEKYWDRMQIDASRRKYLDLLLHEKNSNKKPTRVSRTVR